MKRPIRRPRRMGWESWLDHATAADLHALRARVDDLEIEYERSESDVTLTALVEAKISLTRRTSFLHRQVADTILRVRVPRFTHRVLIISYPAKLFYFIIILFISLA